MNSKLKLPSLGLAILPGVVYFAKTKKETILFCKEMEYAKETWDGCWSNGNGSIAITTSCDTDFHILVALNFEEARTRSVNQIRAVLVHEAVHVAQKIFEGIGELNPAHESQAYLVQAVSLFLMNEYDSLLKKARKK